VSVIKNGKDYSTGGMLLPERQWYANADSGLYSFGVNGQLKDDEIAGVGNSYSAEYWQYDSRLIRRFNQDPKPNPSISNYACFANNPIWFADPDGDSIKVKYGGFLFLFKKTATYKEGEWYDKKGDKVESDNKFFNVVKDAVTELESKTEGTKMVDELENSEKIFVIKRLYGEIDQGMFSARSNKDATDPSKGSGGVIRIAIRHTKEEPVYITLGHEFGHGIAANRGKTNNERWYTVTGSMYGVSKDEQVAVYYENLIRLEHGLPLRQYYTPETKQGPISDTHGLSP